MLERMWRKGNPVHFLWECKLLRPLWKTVWRFLKKVRLELSYDPAILLLGVYPKNTKTLIRKDMYPYVHCSIIHNSQDMETI